jgi:YD repeat-containing protein
MSTPETQQTADELAEFARLAHVKKELFAATVVAVHEANVAACMRGVAAKPYGIIKAWQSLRGPQKAEYDEGREEEATNLTWWQYNEYSNQVAIRRTDGENSSESAFTDLAESYHRHVPITAEIRATQLDYDEGFETYGWETEISKYIWQHTEGARQKAILEMVPFVNRDSPIPPKLGATIVAQSAVLGLCPWPELNVPEQ